MCISENGIVVEFKYYFNGEVEAKSRKFGGEKKKKLKGSKPRRSRAWSPQWENGKLGFPHGIQYTLYD